MTQPGQLNLDWSAALVSGLVAAGIREVVVSPGSRSTPLTLACLRHPQLRCEVILDERSAAWFALGRARATRQPVALLCTSGTAAANWLPAVVEANQSAVPLLLLSADRPPELQGWGANQTIDQTGLFAGQVRAFHAPGAPFAGFDARWLHQLAARAVAESCWPLPGPVHLNLAFREPLLPDDPRFEFTSPDPIDTATPEIIPDARAVAAMAASLSGRRGVIVCGGGEGKEFSADFPQAVTALAAVLACPILAEPQSGLRFGPHSHSHVCSGHELWLRDASTRTALAPEWILRFGAYPVTRTLQGFLGGCSEHYLVEAHGRWPDPAHQTRQLLRGDATAVCRALLATPLRPASNDWLRGFAEVEAVAAARLATAPLPPEGQLFSRLCRSLPAGSQFFCGNSLPIRDLAAFSGSGAKPIAFFANRGASGIDGNIATAAGLAVSGPTLAVIGDLTAQHDLGSLALMRDRPLVLVVCNNGGGGIFDLLPQAGLPEFEHGWRTPQQLDFGHAAAAFGIAFQRTEDVGLAVAEALSALAEMRPLLIELLIDREDSLLLRQAL
jgi:2-succinyl-5-enolpyruvyl-6-hydroxy-3-cyclohexene-1-carboxylate synthase